jgi:hypothetical protein
MLLLNVCFSFSARERKESERRKKKRKIFSSLKNGAYPSLKINVKRY